MTSKNEHKWDWLTLNAPIVAMVAILVDYLFFFAPLGAALFAYVIVFKPVWFKEMIDAVYGTNAE